MKASKYAMQIGSLSKNEKVYFYEMLAHSLTISIREIWSNPKINNDEIVKQLKEVNEIQHRVTAKIKVERLELHSWSESDFIQMINHHITLCPEISRNIAYAIEFSYKATINKGK
jgi:hypothetical protein